MTHLETDVPPQRADTAARASLPGWWPLDCLRSLGRAASIATGQAFQQHAEDRGFGILTSGQNGGYSARVTHWQGQAIRVNGQLKQRIDNARFASHEEAAQHARFLIASGAFNHLALNIRA